MKREKEKEEKCCLSYSLKLFKKIIMNFGLGLGQNFQQFLSFFYHLVLLT